MAGPLSLTARTKSLSNDYGPTRGPNAADGFRAAIYDDHPEFGGVELDTVSCPGYARVVVDNDDFAVVGGGIEVTVAVADATGPWTKTGRWVLLLNAADLTEVWDYVPVTAVRPSEASTFDPLRITVFYSDDSTTPA